MMPTMSLADLVAVMARTLGIAPTDLDPELPLGAGQHLESARVVELAVVLEEELDMVLPDDVDLREQSPRRLHALLPGSSTAR